MKLDSNRKLQPIAGLAIVVSVLLASRASEAIDLLRFPLAWIGVLVCLDGLVRGKHGRSPLAKFSDWLWPLAASIAFWDVFELVNLRLQNWWYTASSRSVLAGAIFSAASFATVLPAVRLIEALAVPRTRAMATRAVRSDPLTDVRPRGLLGNPTALAASGALAFGLAMAFPHFCFPFAWLFIWPLSEAAILLIGPRLSGVLASPLESWREGDRKPFFRLLACGIPLGLIWEGLNWGCARGWVYTVPFFESHKLFEMPLAGFLGYPPFLLEAGAVLALVDRARNALRTRPPMIVRIAAVAVLAATLTAFHLACDSAARTRSVLSFEGEPRAVAMLRLRARTANLSALDPFSKGRE